MPASTAPSPTDEIRSGPVLRLIAQHTPQRYDEGDLEDLPGEVEWDCTEYVRALDPAYLATCLKNADAWSEHEVLDFENRLLADPACPEVARAHTGRHSIYIAAYVDEPDGTSAGPIHTDFLRHMLRWH